MIEPGTIVRLKSPRHRDTLEDMWYVKHWEALTPMVYLGPLAVSSVFSEILVPGEGVATVLHERLTTRMRRMG